MKNEIKAYIMKSERCYDIEDINELISNLPHHKAKILGMYLAGYTYDEIASMYMGTPEYIKDTVNDCITDLENQSLISKLMRIYLQ